MGAVLHVARVIVVGQQEHLTGGELLADERDDILQTIELALVPAADMLDAAAPGFGIHVVLILYDEPQQEGFDPPTAHGQASSYMR
jgi:hypothetical protein